MGTSAYNRHVVDYGTGLDPNTVPSLPWTTPLTVREMLPVRPLCWGFPSGGPSTDHRLCPGGEPEVTDLISD